MVTKLKQTAALGNHRQAATLLRLMTEFDQRDHTPFFVVEVFNQSAIEQLI